MEVRRTNKSKKFSIIVLTCLVMLVTMAAVASAQYDYDYSGDVHHGLLD